MSTWNSGGGPPPIVPRPPSRGGPNVALIAGIAAAVLAIGGGVAYFVLSPNDPDEPAGQQSSVSAQTSEQMSEQTSEQDENDNDRLMKVLPRGYPDGACTPVARLDGALATIACTVNKDPGGPMSATYSLLVDSAALKAAIDNLGTISTVVDCPGRIQSPGPWRHNASLHEVSGTLMCGIQNDNPMLAWTNVDDQMFAVVQGRPAGPTLDNLYAWWSTHS